ncbi:MAG: hypothetical protein COA42_11960 [Alteromonadaceae bacterium]|nr:MAG: hypothetical protein COA42_11960 [Alteromonadaceae bacterium]
MNLTLSPYISLFYERKIRKIKKCNLLLCIAIAITWLLSPQPALSTTLKWYNAGWAPDMQRYQNQILSLILDYSIEPYGKYNIEYLQRDIPGERSLLELSEGRNIHIEMTTIPIRDKTLVANVDQIKMPIYQNILGLRKLIIRKGERKKFANIRNGDDFRHFRAGQGKDWPDVKILQSGGIKVVESIGYTRLYPMLEKRRFDYIPLSIVEVESALNDIGEIKNQFTIVPDIYIFYPIPVYLNASKRINMLPQRIRYGLRKLIESGSLQRLFSKKFSHITKTIGANAKVFILKNGSISTAENTESAAQALNLYFPRNTQVFEL